MQTPETYVLILRLVLAGVLGGLIGAEREYRAKTAGMRTHVLVAIGAALMLIVSRWGFDGTGDPERRRAELKYAMRDAGYYNDPNVLEKLGFRLQITTLDHV